MCAKMIILISFEIANYNGVRKAKDKMKSNLPIFSYTFSAKSHGSFLYLKRFFSPQKLHSNHGKVKDEASLGFAINSQDNLGQVLSLTWGFVWIQNEETKL